MTDASQTARAGIASRLTQWIDVLAPSAAREVRIDCATTRELLALLVACRAELGGAPATIIDLSKSEYSIGGVS